MLLTSLRVRKFRNIIDSGVVAVEADVTCMVGMNESGKTTVLAALHRLNPVDDATFDVQRDYPRWLLVADRRAGAVAKAKPIEATFALDDADREAAVERLGDGVLTGDTVTVARTYEDGLQWAFDWDAPKAVANLLERANIRKKTTTLFAGVTDLDGIPSKYDAVLAADGETPSDVTKEEIARIKAEHEKLKGNAGSVLVATLHQRLPRFFYFSDYSVLKGRVDVTRLEAAHEETASSSAQTARALLALATTTPAALKGSDYEERKAELEAVGHDLTRQVFEYWKQNPNLRVQFDIDRQIETVNGQPQVVRTYLDIRVEDTRHAFTNNFSQRSSGFRWFFSFLAAFTEFEGRDEPFVVLLDEPGLTLHGRAQADFLRFINERLASAVQVIYTTHSPFMVETDRIDRVRIVEDKGPDFGATVTQEALSVGDDSLFPLQAALGYDLAQHLYIGDTNLLVEGPSDFVYLDAISRRLVETGGIGLDDRWRILPAGGASNIPAFVTLLGRNLDVTVLIDSGTEGSGRLEAALAAGRLAKSRLVAVAEITGSKHSDIEDLFTPEDYLTLFNAAFGTTHTVADLGVGDRIVKRLTDLSGSKFDHYKPADALLRDPALLDGLSGETLEAWSRLFERINSTLLPA